MAENTYADLPPDFEPVASAGKEVAELPPDFLPASKLSNPTETESAKLAQMPAAEKYPLLAARGIARAVPGSTDVGSALMAGLTYLGAEPPGVKTTGSFGERFESARKKQEAIDAAAAADYPTTTYGSELAGSFALPVVGPAMRIASLARPMVGVDAGRALATGLVGAGYGGLYGATSGGSASERANSAGVGALLGGAGGAALPAVVGGIGSLAGRGVQALGFGNPEKLANKQLTDAFALAGKHDTSGMSLRQLAEADMANQPVLPIDIGGSAIKDMAKTAANLSPESRGHLISELATRAAGQQSRLYDFASNLIGKDLADPSVTQKIQEAARAVNTPAYAAAMAKGANGVWNDTLGRLVNHPWVQKAIPEAIEESNAEAISKGLQGFKNPFVKDANGNLSLPVDANGNTIQPTLEFWDTVRKNINGRINAASSTPTSRGDPNTVRVGNLISKQLTDQLDKLIPEYATARSGAGRFLGEESAYDFGKKFLSATNAAKVNSGLQAIQKFTPEELEYAQHSYMSERIQKYMNRPENANIAKSFMNPIMKAKDAAILGPDKAKQLEAFLAHEGLMNNSLTSLNGSDTARNAANIAKAFVGHNTGMLGGATLGGLDAYRKGSSDPLDYAKEMAVGALAGHFGQKRANNLSEKTSLELAKKLVSDDPAVWRMAVDAISKNPQSKISVPWYINPAALSGNAPKEIQRHNQSKQLEGSVDFNNERLGRASGGRVMTAEKLMRLAQSAKKHLGQSTKPILEAPDEHVVRALKIANSTI